MSEVSRYWVNSDGYLYGCNPAWPPEDDELVMWPDFKRVQDECDALQQRLNAADQSNEDLSGLLQGLIDNPFRFNDAYRARIAAALNPTSETPDQLRDAAKMIGTDQPDRIKGMIETWDGKFAIMIDEANAHYGWTFAKDPNGMWVSGRKATDAEMHAARTYVHITNQQ